MEKSFRRSSSVDQTGDVLNILVQRRRDGRAAKRFFRKLTRDQRCVPKRIVTDKLRSYSTAHRAVIPTVEHARDKGANNQAENSHPVTRQRERQMRRFKSVQQMQRFLSAHGPINNLFRVGRHLLNAANSRLLRGRAFGTWNEVVCAQNPV